LVEQALHRVDLAQHTGLRQPVPFPIVLRTVTALAQNNDRGLPRRF
jgi:hypothetical protein